MKHIICDKIILASESEARKQLLKKYDIPFEACPTNVSEDHWNHPDPAIRAYERALAKMNHALTTFEVDVSSLIIASDQTMACQGVIYDKAQDEAEARDRLKILQGQCHSLYNATILSYMHRDEKHILATLKDESHLKVKPLSDHEIDGYLKLGEWRGSVGCMRIEGAGKTLLQDIDGDEDSIQGLPMKLIFAQLQSWQVTDFRSLPLHLHIPS
ncbi:MAG: Maf family protein [Proteobacteria bacterium]|nr:Maf family protein [Pseudomonadota bacterium]